MLFNSLGFALFFLAVYAIYWLLKRRLRAQNWLLLAASLFFYGWWDVRFLYLFILTTTVDFYCALMIQEGRVPRRQRIIESLILIGSAVLCVTVQWKAIAVIRDGLHMSLAVDWSNLWPHEWRAWAVLIATVLVVLAVNLLDPWLTSFDESRRRKIFLVASVVSNLSVLGFFKYYNFFATSFSDAVHWVSGTTPSAWTLHIILPVGISFYTFQSLAYTIDVYRRKFQPIPHYLTLATGLSFFPLLVAGPIERPNHLLPQFLRPRTINGDQWREGMWLIVWGLFKKMVVADNMAIIVNSVFRPYDGANPSHAIPADGAQTLIGIYAFAFQIYGDFSGYSDIARGLARLLGFDIMLNFRLPYFAISPSDFWQRWHISLSSWLRDYLYIPLGGSRGGLWRTYRNLFLTMLLGGLWHGASWTFVVWGCYHGLLLIAYRLVAPDLGEKKQQSLIESKVVRRPIEVYSLFLPFVPFGRGQILNWRLIRHCILVLLMFHLTCFGWLLFRAQNLTTVALFSQSMFTDMHWSSGATELLHHFVYYAWVLLIMHLIQQALGTLTPMKNWHWFIRLNVWVLLVLSLLALSAKPAKFIYFDF